MTNPWKYLVYLDIFHTFSGYDGKWKLDYFINTVFAPTDYRGSYFSILIKSTPFFESSHLYEETELDTLI